MDEEMFPKIPELDNLPGYPFIELRQRWGKQPKDFRDMKYPKVLIFSVNDTDTQTYISAFERRGIRVIRHKQMCEECQTLEIRIPSKEYELRVTKIRRTLDKWTQRQFMRKFMKTDSWFVVRKPC